METRPSNPVRQAWAVGRLTLKEASRRKAFSVLIFFGIALISSMTFFAVVDLESRLRLLELWSTRVSSFFAAIVGIVLAAFSLPNDIEQKRIYLLASKPISKITYFLGKFVGFALLLALFFAIMGVISVAYIRVVGLIAGRDFPRLLAKPRSFGEWHREGDVLKNTLDTDLWRMEGGRKGWITWEFRGLKANDFEETIPLRLKMQVYHKTDVFLSSGQASVVASNSEGKPVFETLALLQSNEWATVDLPAKDIPADGVLRLVITPAEPLLILIATRDGVHLFQKPESFEWNFVKGSLLMFLQSVMVMAVTLMGSSFLSAPVSLLLGIVLYLFGSIHGYVSEGVRDISWSLAHAQGGDEHAGHSHGPGELPNWMYRFSTQVSGAVLYVVPDFDAFDFSRFLLSDLAVSGEDIVHGLKSMALLVGVFLIVGVVAIIFRDFG